VKFPPPFTECFFRIHYSFFSCKPDVVLCYPVPRRLCVASVSEPGFPSPFRCERGFLLSIFLQPPRSQKVKCLCTGPHFLLVFFRPSIFTMHFSATSTSLVRRLFLFFHLPTPPPRRFTKASFSRFLYTIVLFLSRPVRFRVRIPFLCRLRPMLKHLCASQAEPLGRISLPHSFTE